MSAPAYLIVEMHVRDLDRYRQYMAEAPAAVKAFGGEYLVRGGRHETLEGDWRPHRVVLLRFPSFEQAEAFYDSELYRAAREARGHHRPLQHGACRGHRRPRLSPEPRRKDRPA